MNKITLYVVTHKDFLEKIVDRTVIGVGAIKKLKEQIYMTIQAIIFLKKMCFIVN